MNNEEKKIIGYDPNTGAPIYEEAKKIVSYDPNTGAPIYEETKKIVSYDPNTGAPIYEEAQTAVPATQEPSQPALETTYVAPVVNQGYVEPAMQPTGYQAPAELNKTSYQPVQNSNEPKKSHTGLIIGVIIGIIMLIAAIIIGYFVFFNNEEESSSSSSSSSNKPQTTINDYDEDDDDNKKDDNKKDDNKKDDNKKDDNKKDDNKKDDDKDSVVLGHIKYKKYAGYEYILSNNNILVVKYNDNGCFSFFENTMSAIEKYVTSEEEFTKYLTTVQGLKSVDSIKSYDGEYYSAILASGISSDDEEILYFLSTTVSDDYLIEGVIMDYNDDADLITILGYLDNIIYNSEEI